MPYCVRAVPKRPSSRDRNSARGIEFRNCMRANQAGASCTIFGIAEHVPVIARAGLCRSNSFGSWGRSVSPYTAKASVDPVRLTLAPGLPFWERAKQRSYLQGISNRGTKKRIVLKFRQTFGAAVFALTTLGWSTADAGVIYNYSFDGSNSHGSYSATVSLFSQGGQVISGSGSITGGG